MKQIVIIADDLTGACDTGVKFRQQGLKTKVLVSPNSADILNTSPVPVVSINTDTRSAGVEAAAEVVEKLTEQLRYQGDYFYYKKVDSVLRGNICGELEAMFRVLKPDFALVAPAFPATGRWLKDGVLSIGNKEKPQLQIDALKRISFSTQRRCGHIHLETVRQGTDAVIRQAEALYKEGCTILLADTWCEVDLETLADVVLRLGSRCLPVGSAGLATHLAGRLAENNAEEADGPTPDQTEGALVVVVGSRHPVTVEQVQNLKKAVSMETYLLDVAGISQENLHSRVESAFREKRSGAADSILLTTDYIYNSSDNCQHLLQQNAYNQSILDGIGACVEKLAKKTPIRGMIATGGDIASEILGHLKLEQIDLMEEPIPGIVTGYAADSSGKGFRLATKSGGFGDPDALLELYKYMQRSQYEKE